MISVVPLLVLLVLTPSVRQGPGGRAIWIEAETPSSSNVKFGDGFPGRPELLSGGKWLTVTGEVPAEGADLTYKFTSDAGSRDIWHRVGFEGARSPFEWRIDEGAWKTVGSKTHTIDLQELAEWNGVAWMDMGQADLAAGDHKLEIRIPRPSKGDVLYGSDAFALVRGEFQPNGKWKPGEDPLTPEDRQAATHTFAIPATTSAGQQTIKLGGTWLIARDDELSPGLVAEPMVPIDKNPVWRAIQVPGDKSDMRADMALAHRVWYRTSVVVDPSQTGKAFVLTFHQNSLNTTVIVNGQFCGFNKNPWVKWSCDITSAVHAGQNEILVGIRDAWYGFTQDPKNPGGIWENFALPQSRCRMGFLHLDYPVWADFKSGLLDTPELTVAGRTYASDVFARPSVAKKRLDVDVTVKRDGSPGPVKLLVEALDADTHQPVAHWQSPDLAVVGGDTQTFTVGGEWTNPDLWWPDHPKMYVLRVHIEQDGKEVDRSETPFGFREWTVDGPHYLLNGVIWHGWAELTQGDTPEVWLANYRKTGQRLARMAGAGQSGDIHWLGMPFDTALDWCDWNGVTIRRCGPLDGEAIGYMPIDDQGGINKPLLANVRDQIVAQVKGERNHPSVNMWSVENEWLYINTLNLWGGLMDQFEADMAGTIAAVRAVDPTRLAMTDGGSAGKANILPVQGDHYVYTNDPNDYPDLAYGDQPKGAGRGRWTYDGKRPRYAGEDYFATGINPADYAWIQGEGAFGGKADSARGMAMVQRMITEGYRWGGVFTAFHLWIGDEGKSYPDKYAGNAERAVFVRQYDSAFSSGASVTRTLGVFNDSHSSDPLVLDWRVSFGGKEVQKGTRTLAVPPGTNEKFDVTLHVPSVTARTSGIFALTLTAGGKEVFKSSKALVALPDPVFGKTPLALFDPGGTVAAYLSARKVVYTPVGSLTALPADAQVLLVGPDALSEADSSDPRLSAYALDGHRVIVLEQKNPLRFGALPVELQPADGGGAFGFADDQEHAVVKGLANDDFRAWGPNARLYERPYAKASSGMRSIVEVGPRLAQTALAEVPVGKGLVVLCQLQLAHNLSRGGPSRTLLANLIAYASSYKLVSRPVKSVVADRTFDQALDAIGVRRTEAAGPLAAIEGDGIAVVSATPSNLLLLAANLPKVHEFTSKGGYLVLNGLTAEGLAAYNKIVGVQHMIRPFRREKTALATPRDTLATGITNGDVVMYSGEKMFDFNDDHWAASDIFSTIVDTDDVAPFAQLPSEDFLNTVNGFVSSDGWKYIFSFDLQSGPPQYTMSFPQTMAFREMTWVGNGFYHKVKKIGLSFDGGPVVPFDVQPNTDPQVLPIVPARVAKSIRVTILDWTRDPGVKDVVGIDNIYLKVGRPADWYQKVHPLLNIGGLVRYPQGKGAVVLANLAFEGKESVPENGGKKRAIMAAILRNLGATFVGGSNLIIPGAHGVTYTPISLAGKATAYRNERGWFGDADHTFAALPTGKQVFGSVPFDVYDFPTSPVPTAVVLGGPGVPGNLPDHVAGIKVGAKASALFFLQTARMDARRDDRERREGKKYEMAHYVVTYADGSTATVPIYAELDIDDYRQQTPHDLPGARVAWSKPFGPGSESATAYLMEWTNPKPNQEIASIALEYGHDRRGIPALLAITAAR